MDVYVPPKMQWLWDCRKLPSAGGTMSELSSHAKRERYYCSRQLREYLTIQKENKFNHKELYEVF
jgi:hypothetical protein